MNIIKKGGDDVSASNSKRLTLKQKKFADYYIETGNATEAAIRAGYSEKTAKEMGYENLTKPHIKNYIDKRLKDLENKQIAKAEEVLKYLSSVMRGEAKDIIIQWENGEPYPVEVPPKTSDRLKAAELLGKRYALFTERNEVIGSMEIEHNPLKQLSTEDLKKLAEALTSDNK